MGVPLPKFNRVERDAIASPVWRSGNILPFEAAFNCANSIFECGAICEWLTLVARPCADLTLSRAAEEIGIAVSIGGWRDRSFDANLSIQMIPVKQERRLWTMRQRKPLAAESIREENRAVLVESSQENDSQRRRSIRIHGCDRHRIWIWNRKLKCFGEPAQTFGDRIRRRLIEVHRYRLKSQIDRGALRKTDEWKLGGGIAHA